MVLQIPDRLREKLAALRARQLQRAHPDEVFASQDVVILTLGFGPAIYLGLDGRMVIWHYMEDEPPRVTEDIKDIAPGLVIGAKNQELPELLDLLPSRPTTAVECPLCSGQRWVAFGSGSFVCWECNGLGWKKA